MSRLSFLAIALSLLVAGCGDDDAAPTTPTTPAVQNQFVFTAALSAANEVPPVSNAEAGGRGQATITMKTTRDAAGAITGATLDVSATYTGFPAGSSITIAHIHQAAAGVNGGVVINTLPAAGEVTFPNGSGSFVRGGFPISPVDLANQIINNPAGFYFNSHTALNPGGAVRGQLVRQ